MSLKFVDCFQSRSQTRPLTRPYILPYNRITFCRPFTQFIVSWRSRATSQICHASLWGHFDKTNRWKKGQTKADRRVPQIMVCLSLTTYKYAHNCKTLTFLEAVSGKRKAKRGPFNKFKWILNMVVTVLLGGADNRYIWKQKAHLISSSSAVPHLVTPGYRPFFPHAISLPSI